MRVPLSKFSKPVKRLLCGAFRIVGLVKAAAIAKLSAIRSTDSSQPSNMQFQRIQIDRKATYPSDEPRQKP
jgi:hypothetical protein